MRWNSNYNTVIISFLAAVAATVLVFVISAVNDLSRQVDLLDSLEKEMLVLQNWRAAVGDAQYATAGVSAWVFSEADLAGLEAYLAERVGESGSVTLTLDHEDSRELGGGYSALPARLEIRSRFSQVVRTIEHLERAEQRMVIEGVRVSRLQSEGQFESEVFAVVTGIILTK